jgi:uncharacterized protein (TIGR00730 family)
MSGLSICLFCGSRTGASAIFAEQVQKFCSLLAQSGGTLITGGGHVGLMGLAADAVLAQGGRVIGVIPAALADQELAHDGLTKLHIVNSMHERKALMADLADVFVAAPGGIGTLEEFFEVWTWRQLGLHAKPLALLNVSSYYGALLDMLQQAKQQDFVDRPTLDLLHVADDAESLWSWAQALHAPPLHQDRLLSKG